MHLCFGRARKWPSGVRCSPEARKQEVQQLHQGANHGRTYPECLHSGSSAVQRYLSETVDSRNHCRHVYIFNFSFRYLHYVCWYVSEYPFIPIRHKQNI